MAALPRAAQDPLSNRNYHLDVRFVAYLLDQHFDPILVFIVVGNDFTRSYPC